MLPLESSSHVIRSSKCKTVFSAHIVSVLFKHNLNHLSIWNLCFQIWKVHQDFSPWSIPLARSSKCKLICSILILNALTTTPQQLHQQLNLSCIYTKFIRTVQQLVSYTNGNHSGHYNSTKPHSGTGNNNTGGDRIDISSEASGCYLFRGRGCYNEPDGWYYVTGAKVSAKNWLAR